jgi:hypothetical protein
VTTVTSKRLGMPKRAGEVHANAAGVPERLGGVPVDSVREDWVVEDRWWTGRPLRRRYFELVLDDGRDVVVFHDLRRRRWYVQRG